MVLVSSVEDEVASAVGVEEGETLGEQVMLVLVRTWILIDRSSTGIFDGQYLCGSPIGWHQRKRFEETFPQGEESHTGLSRRRSTWVSLRFLHRTRRDTRTYLAMRLWTFLMMLQQQQLWNMVQHSRTLHYVSASKTSVLNHKNGRSVPTISPVSHSLQNSAVLTIYGFFRSRCA